MKAVYLAGPEVFFPDAEEVAAHLRAACAAAGLKGLFPTDAERPTGPGVSLAHAIYKGNVALIDRSAAVIADIRPFRGAGMDPGTAWEIGYAIARGLPVFAWSVDLRAYAERVGPGRPGPRGPVDADGLLIEDFGLVENLMIAESVRAIDATFEAALERCAAHLLGDKAAQA
ncbi:MAG: nucleoside 2-deoxyribosyltransferase [Geminicoccaceae bacterium]